MEMSEVLCLKWNNHKSIFLQNLSSLRTQELYSDATITCNGKYFSVHRLVLSTCSEYFEEIFERISMQSIHPFIIVTNIESGYLEALLNFMYNGEVNVLHEMLPGLIKAAEILKIKGLAVPDEEAIEKELLYAREREANIPNKETHATVPKSPNEMHQTQPINLNPPSNCILPDDMSIHTGMVPQQAVQQKEAQPIEATIYHPKDQVVEMCPMESPGDYGPEVPEEHIRDEPQNEIKLESDPMCNTTETIQPVHPSPLPVHPLPPQHFSSPPPAHTQIMPPPESEHNAQELSLQNYAPSMPMHQTFIKEPLKHDYEAEVATTKCSSWEGATTGKEIDSNAAAAAAVQEVIQGLMLQPEPEETQPIPHDNGANFPQASQTRHLRQVVKTTESPSPPPPPPLPPSELPKPKVKRRRSNSGNASSTVNHAGHEGGTSSVGASSPSPSSSYLSASKTCPKCPYATKYMSTMRRHIMFKHTGEKPHQCHFCPYRSAHNFNMKKHMMIHTGEKPFSCPLCSYKAAQNSNIKSHMKSHEKKLLQAAIKGIKKEKEELVASGSVHTP